MGVLKKKNNVSACPAPAGETISEKATWKASLRKGGGRAWSCSAHMYGQLVTWGAAITRGFTWTRYNSATNPGANSDREIKWLQPHFRRTLLSGLESWKMWNNVYIMTNFTYCALSFSYNPTPKYEVMNKYDFILKQTWWTAIKHICHVGVHVSYLYCNVI